MEEIAAPVPIPVLSPLTHKVSSSRESMEGRRNGGDVGLWSRYRDHTTRGSRSSSSSGYTSAGTIVSISTGTGYTSNSSRLSSISSLGLEAAIHMDLKLDEDRSRPTKKSRKETEISKEKQKEKEELSYRYRYQEEEIEKKAEIEEIKILIQEFLGAPSPSADCSLNAKGGNIGVLDWWLKHLGVGWVLNIADDYVSAAKLEHTFDHARSWTRALAKIARIIRFMASSLCSDGHGHGSVGLPSSNAEKEEEPETETGNKDSTPDLFQFAQFIQETMLKLLVFVDVIVEGVLNGRALRPYNEVNTLISDHSALLADVSALLSVHDALSNALSEILWLFGRSPPSEGAGRIKDIVRILSEKQTKAAEAIWSTMKQILMVFTKDRDNLSCSLDTQASSDVHRATLFVVKYIGLLCSRYWLVAAIVYEAARNGKYEPQTGNVSALDSMVREIVSCLPETLANRSKFFPDRGLGFLFLLNNLYFIWQELIPYNKLFSLQENMVALVGKLMAYKNSYICVSWAPMLSSLLYPTPLCFKRNCTLLPKFEDEFQKTYTTQKLWKVPNPELRKTLRRAIIDEIIPGYTKYIEDNKIRTPNSSPQNLKEMLQELFEG